MSLAMTKEEREAFLADVHIGILAVADGSRGPLTVPIWYSYEPGGEIRFVTASDSRKAKRIREGGRVSLCVQTEAPPYRYVTVEGPIAGIESVDVERDLRPLARRYLGVELGDQYTATTTGEMAASILVRIRPERWLSVDYRKQYGG